MVNGNFSLILNYTILAGLLSLRVTSTKNDLAKFIHISDPFTTEILKIWSEISCDDNITSTENLLSLPLWQNSLVRIGNKPLYYKSWSSKGIQNVRYLMKDTDNLLSFTEFKERFDVKTKFLVYHGVVSCIRLLRNAIEDKHGKTEISALL